MIAEQLVFGYRDGHRRLAGSIELDRGSSAALLGATDATISAHTERLLSALPLPSVGLYAVCGTWSDPGADRPGAVWAHALLIPLDQVGEFDDLYAVVSALRRPSIESLLNFSEPLAIEAGVSAPTAQTGLKTELLAEILATSLDPDKIPVVAATDLVAGETALIALWNAAWSELRAHLSFRTRERVKAAPELGYICVARRVTGIGRPGRAMIGAQVARLSSEAWVDEIAQPGLHGARRDARRFLHAFGGEAQTSLAQLVTLGELYELVRREEVILSARTIAADYPKPAAMPTMKKALFGRDHAYWWDASELDVVLAIFDVAGKGFDLENLAFPARLRQLVAGSHGVSLIEASQRTRSTSLSELLFDALVAEATPSLIGATIELDPDLAQRIVSTRPEILESQETWRALDTDQAASVAKKARLSDRAIAAAAMADRVVALAQVISLPTAAIRLFRSRNLDAFARLFDPRHAGKAAVAGKVGDGLRIEAAAMGEDVGTESDLIAALESRRGEVNEAWLRAAVRLLASAGARKQRAALEVVFGPLHHAVTDDRLPHDLWQTLDRIAPRADDPAQRLRRLLLTRARKEHWPQEAFERALRGSGPHVKEFKSELDDDDDEPIGAMAQSVLRKWKRFV